MDIEMYYFSGTGNTLAVASEIARKIVAKLIPVQKVMNEGRITVTAQNIGVVFPSYLAGISGVPLIVERFLRKITNIETLHIFAICTCGGYESVNAIPTLFTFSRIVRSCGGKVSVEYSVRLPMNNLDYDHIPIPIERDSEVIISRSKKKIFIICDCILRKKGTSHKGIKTLFFLLLKPPFRLMQKSVIRSLLETAREPVDSKLEYPELIPLTDKSIAVGENCTGCGTCARVCPVKNIQIVNGRPLFQHKCEMCFACDEWCPLDAIHHWGRSPGVKYHHPDIRLSDMLVNDSNVD